MNPTERTPHVVWVLLTLNVVVFTFEVLLGQRSAAFQQFIYTFGATPAQITRVLLRPGQWFPFPMITPVTSMFIHGGVMHLAGNMLFLYIFGDNIEDELGHGRFIFFYLICGLAGAAIHILLSPTSPVPMVGASGAISGVMGAYILFFPRARVLTLVFFFIITMIEIPAYWFLAIWFIMQFFGGLNTLTGLQGGGTAFWAHVGGFLMGMWLARIWMRYRPQRQRIIWWQ